MVIIITLIILMFLFFAIRKHTGPASLAMIAGVAVYNMSGEQITTWLHNIFNTVPIEIFQHSFYLLLVLLAPILLYLHTPRGGLSGFMRIIDSIVCAVITTSLISVQLAYFFPFDELATTISNFIKIAEPPIVVIGTVFSYLDIILYR